MALLREPDRCARKRSAPPARRRRTDRREPRLSRDVRDRVRLFALDLELGGLHVPDAARREDAAGLEGCAGDSIRRPQDDDLRLDRYANSTRRNRATVLAIFQMSMILPAKPPHTFPDHARER